MESIIVMGFLNSALPFVLYCYAAQSLSASLLSILNSTTPMWGALLGVILLKQHVSLSQAAGLILGVIGVSVVGWDGINEW